MNNNCDQDGDPNSSQYNLTEDPDVLTVEKPRVKKAKKITFTKAPPLTEDPKPRKSEAAFIYAGSESNVEATQASSSQLQPSVDTNTQKVVDLEKEVLELYKMIDYWKSEAKSM